MRKRGVFRGALTLSVTGVLAMLVGSAAAAPPPGYYDSAEGLSGEALKTALYNIIKGHNALPYSSTSSIDTTDALKDCDEDPNDSNNIQPYYRLSPMAKSTFGGSGTAGWNREHVWPQSLGADVMPKKTDLHHLFAEEAGLNSSRGNSAFDNVASPVNSRDGNEWTDTLFEVRSASRGNIARAILYMTVRYPEMTLVESGAPAYNQMGRKSILLQWHNEDPVDAREQLRNDRAYSYQGNRNPFIDHPEYVSLIFSSVSNGNTVTATGTDRAGATIGTGAVRYPLLSVNLTANSGEWDLQTMSVTRLGTLADSNVTALDLYRDSNNNGVVDTGEPRLDTRTFSGGSLTFNLASASRVTATTANFLITASISSASPNGATLGVQVTGVTCNTSTGGTDTNPGALSLSSSTPQVTGGVTNGDSLNVSLANLASATVAASAADYPVLKLSLSAASNEWDLGGFTVQQIGTIADSSIQRLALYQDANGNGLVDTGDSLLQTRTLSAGTAAFSLTTPVRIQTTVAHFIVAASLSNSAVNGQTVQLRLVANSLQHNSSGGADTNPAFANFDSTAATVTGGVTNGNSITVQGTSVAPATVNAGTPEVPMLSVLLTPDAGEWDLGAVSITKIGTVADSAVSAYQLYEDSDQDGQVDPTDQLLDSTSVITGGQVTFNPAGALRVSGVPSQILIAASLSSSAAHNSTLQLRLNANGLTAASTGGTDNNPVFSDVDSNVTTVQNNNSGTVKIAMVSTRANTSSDIAAGSSGGFGEYLVLANQTDFAINLEGWSLKKLAGPIVLNLSGVIPPRSHFLIASAGFASSSNIDGSQADLFVDNASSSKGIFGSGVSEGANTAIGLYNGSEKVDGFAWGTGIASGDTSSPTVRDGTPFSPVMSSTQAETRVYKRKGIDPVTKQYQDTGDNSADLETAVKSAPPSSSTPVPVTVSAFAVE